MEDINVMFCRVIIYLFLLFTALLEISIEPAFADTNTKKSIDGIIPVMPFIENRGQIHNQVLYYAPLCNGTVFVTIDGIIVYSIGSEFLHEELIGSKNNQISGRNLSKVEISYFHGSNMTKWSNHIPAYDIVDFGQIYDKINVHLRACGKNVEKIFTISPGADPDDIKLRIQEGQTLTVNALGQLEVGIEKGSINFTRPLAYQEINGEKVAVEVTYKVDDNQYGFTLGDYNTDYTLIIDPLLASTYLGGNGGDGFGGTGLAADAEGNIYIVGYTNSSNFPPDLGNYQSPINGNNDIYICKLNPGLTDVLAAASIGGSGNEQYPGITINNEGEVVIAGYTYSADFPVTPGVVGSSFLGGPSDFFVAVLDGGLNTLIASTYLAGSQAEGPYNRPGIITTADGDIYVSGTTSSSDFPKTPTAYDTIYGGTQDYFITRLNNDLTTIKASTFVGGSGIEEFPSLVIDSDANIFLGGSTGSSDYPTTENSYNRTHTGAYFNASLSKFDDALSNLLASTFLGDAGAVDLIIDNQGNLYYTGHTDNTNYVTTPGVYDRTHNGYNEGFISKICNDLQNMLASTFLSGTTNSFCFINSLAFDANGNLFGFGMTDNANFPTTADAIQSEYGGGMNDAVIIKMDIDLTSVAYSSFIGGAADDAGIDVICDSDNAPIMAGHTASTNLWTSSNAYSRSYNGGEFDAFVAKLYLYRKCGDANDDNSINVGDAVYLIAYVFKGGPGPDPVDAGDANCDGDVNVGDAVYLINYVFKSGPEPCCP